MSKTRARLRNSTGRGYGRPGLDISSLIDVSFLLLIYFLVTSTLDPKETDLGANLGFPGPVGIAEPDPIEIRISEEGIISADNEIYSADATQRELPLLRERLQMVVEARELSARFSEPQTVFVHADDKAQGQRFIDVMNCLSEAGITNVVLSGFVE